MEKDILLKSARRIADWYCRNTTEDGKSPYYVFAEDRKIVPGYEWNAAFLLMGLTSAYTVFGDKKYQETAEKVLKHIKSLQIMDPASPHYGAFREITPETNWCYVRDALSAAWALLEIGAVSGDHACIERALLWGEWFMRHGMDETGWPLWGLFFAPLTEADKKIQMCNNMHGCFHGGSLNFFYRLYQVTGDHRWVGGFFEHIADHFVSTIQQKDGFFRSVEKSTGVPPASDPQNGLHRCNDDLGTLGLLCASRVYPKQAYSDGIRKFLDAVFACQGTDGAFETSCASVPVVLNIVHESAYPASAESIELAWSHFLSRQFPEGDPLFAGGLNESALGNLCVRSMAYALIVILKIAGGDCRFLTANGSKSCFIAAVK